MNQTFKKNFRNWANDTNERVKLQHAYLVITITVVLASGVISLFDAPVGRTFVGVAVGALLIFIINAVMWALLHSITTRFAQSPTKTARKK